jgi:biotin operon repressor
MGTRKPKELKDAGRTFIPLVLILGLLVGWNPASAAIDFSEIEKILGAKGQLQEGAWVVRFPRSDLQITIAGETIPTALGFVSWVAFKDVQNKTMLMGDLVLLENEVNPVITALEKNGIEITALHNHFFRENPRLMFMHIGGMGSKAALAKGLRQALDETSTHKAVGLSSPGLPTPALTLNTERLEQIIGHKGQVRGEVFKITVGRQGVKMAGVELTSSMGLNSWAGFVGTEDARAHVAGYIVMTAQEVNRVIQALRQGGIEIVAVHNHMLNEQPRVFFLHYWGTGPAESLAKTVKAAFDQVGRPIR